MMEGMRMKIFLIGAALSGLATASFASTITNGTFSIAGTVFLTGPGGVTTPAGVCPSGSQCLFWQDASTPAMNGKVAISPLGLPNGDIPLGIAGIDAGNISSLINPPDIVDMGGFPPVPFLSFANGGVSTVLEINFIPPGINGSADCSASPPAAGQMCTPPGSLFNLQNLTATSSTASWRFQGVTNDNPSVMWNGIFTSQFNNVPFQTVEAALATNGFVSNTFAGQITLTIIPEPGTVSFLLLGTGMIACATLLRRFSRR
jgi:hypothetical protein